jgi:hypothetical protein
MFSDLEIFSSMPIDRDDLEKLVELGRVTASRVFQASGLSPEKCSSVEEIPGKPENEFTPAPLLVQTHEIEIRGKPYVVSMAIFESAESDPSDHPELPDGWMEQRYSTNTNFDQLGDKEKITMTSIVTQAVFTERQIPRNIVHDLEAIADFIRRNPGKF